MSKSEFDEFVQAQQAEQQSEADFNRQQIAEWLQYLTALYDQITGFMKSYLDTGAAKIELRDIQLNEDFVGAYLAQEMILKIGRATITFTPIGTMLIGSKGRVDVKGPAAEARLSLVNKLVTSPHDLVRVSFGKPAPAPSPEAIKQIEWAWKIITQPPDVRFIELTEEAFFDIILAVANA